MEILPFDAGNGMVARLAASPDGERARGGPSSWATTRNACEAALHAAFQLENRPLARLLESAAERALDV